MAGTVNYRAVGPCKMLGQKAGEVTGEENEEITRKKEQRMLSLSTFRNKLCAKMTYRKKMHAQLNKQIYGTVLRARHVRIDLCGGTTDGGMEMAKGKHHKIRLWELMRILFLETDEDHMLSAEELVERLQAEGIEANRKSIYADVRTLVQEIGVDIVAVREGHHYLYHYGHRIFEDAELRLIIDIIQASSFFSVSKSEQLISELKKLTSREKADELQRNVLLDGRVKTSSKKIYYNIDALARAIDRKACVTFQYEHWNLKKEPELKYNGALYRVSPWQLCWHGENYYLIGYDEFKERLSHYRIDKMVNVEVTDLPYGQKARETFRDLDPATYGHAHFDMFGGRDTKVRLVCENGMINVIVDRFGRDVAVTPLDSDHFSVWVEVVTSEKFFSWIFGFNGQIWIAEPESVRGQMREQLDRIIRQYENC